MIRYWKESHLEHNVRFFLRVYRICLFSEVIDKTQRNKDINAGIEASSKESYSLEVMSIFESQK